MSVYIRGMEMPASCRACRLKMNCDDCEGFECLCLPLGERIGYIDELWKDRRRDDCPLVSVPPHGRLIDADAFIEDECNHCDGACEAMPCNCLTCEEDCRCDLILDIADAPTIIPADHIVDATGMVQAEEGE